MYLSLNCKDNNMPIYKHKIAFITDKHEPTVPTLYCFIYFSYINFQFDTFIS